MNESMNHFEKGAGVAKSNTPVSNKKNSGVSKITKKHLSHTSLLNNFWEWENNPEYDEFWKNN